jgi:hypothetical protein
MAEENKSIQTPQYYPTVNPGYKMSVGANGQGTVFDTNGNIFHFTSPDEALQSALQEANYQGNVELTADNRTMIAAGKDLLSTPFFKLNVLGSINYETSDEELESNNFINIPPTPDPEVTYQKTGDVWEFKFLEQNRGISGFNLTGQSATGQDAIHQLSNIAANVVGQDLKQLYNSSKFYKVDMTGIKMDYGKDTNNKTYYIITIPLISVKDDKSAYVNFEHKGSWSTNKRDNKTARQNALTNIYGDTPFDKSLTNSGPLDTWNFPVTDVNSTGTNKGWPFFNTIKQNFPTYEFVETTTGLDNNIYEIWFQWFDPSTIGKLSIPPPSTPTPTSEETDELDVEGQIFESLPFNENEDPIRKNLGKTYEIEEPPLTQQEVEDITFNIREIQAKVNNGSYSTISKAVLGEAGKTPDGKLYLEWIAYQMKHEGAGGVSDPNDSGGLTTWGVTIGHWKKYAPIVYPGKYQGTAEELKSLNTEKARDEVMIPYIKVTDWDSLGNNTSTAPDLYKVMVYKWKFGGTPKSSWVGKSAADNFYKDTGGDPVTAFWEFWAWRRRCRNVKLNKLNYLSFGIGWHRAIGVCWLVKDPRKKINGVANPNFGKPLPKPTCFKIVGTSRSNSSLYNWALSKGFFQPFHEYELNDSDKKNFISNNTEFVDFSAGNVSVNGISYNFRTD